MPIINRFKLSFCAGITAASLFSLTGSLLAGTDANESKSLVETTKTSVITGDLGVNFVSKYLSRGAMQEDSGVIAQPYADLYVALYEGSGFLNKITLNLGVWASIHDQKTGATPGSGWADWYEFDYTPGFSFVFAKNFTLSTSYTEFNSPNNAFDASRNLSFNLAYDDTDCLGAFALHPHIAYLRELEGIAANGTVGGKGSYYEVGIAPVIPTCCQPVALTLPVTAGFGSNDFYANNQGFGYLSAGVNAAVALKFIPSGFGTWIFNTGATYYRLAGSLATTNAGRHNDWVFNGGIGTTF